MRKCCVCKATCSSWDSKCLRTTFHCFPINRPLICEKWREFADLAEGESLHDKYICSSHFLEEDIIDYPLKRRIKLLSYPCLNPPISRGVLVITPPPSIQTWTSVSISPDGCVNEEKAEVDPAFLDHDYLGTSKPSEQQQNGDPKQLLLQDVRKELCRLCGKKEPLLIPIFSATSREENGEVPFSDKIELHLPFKLKLDDPLPKHICTQCSELLSSWHELYVTCVAADAVLWKTFGGESHVSSHKDVDCSSNRNQDNDEQCAYSAEKEDENGSTLDSENGEAVNEANEEHDVLCSVCGMNTPSNPPKEDDSLIEEFEKFYSKVRSVKYKCRYCCEFFLNPCKKKEHLINCRELPTICEYCGKNDISRKDIQVHKYKKHQKASVVELTCDRCGKYFKSNALFKRHYFLVHIKVRGKKFFCYHCCSAYADEKFYRSHMKKHEKGELKTMFQVEEHLNGEGVYVCPVCNEIFNDALSLVVHLTSKKKIKCPSCSIKVSNERNFMFHVCREWNCSYCFKSFKHKILCVLHERMHTGEKPVKCRTCNKAFRSDKLRAQHEITHTPFLQCTLCNKKFRDKFIFEDHLQWHDGKAFLCSICRKGFCSRKSVKRHIGKCHKGEKAEITVGSLNLSE